MTRSHQIVALALAGILTARPSPALAADAYLVAKLAPEIGKRCVDGSLSAKALGEAIYASKAAPLVAEYAWLSGGPSLVSAQAFRGGSEQNKEALYLLRRLTETWIVQGPDATNYLPIGEGGIEIRQVNGAPAPPGAAEAALTDILRGSDDRFSFRCVTKPDDIAAPQSEDEPKSSVTIAIGKTPDDLHLPLKKKKFAEVSYLNNASEDESSVSINATVGVSFGELTPVRYHESDKRGLLVRAIPTAFVQLDRQGISDGDRDDDIDNLNFGFELGGFVQTRRQFTRTHYYALSARYLTDLGFHSSAWTASFSLTPEIPLPGNDVPFDIIPNRLVFDWLARGTADFTKVTDPGEKTALVDKPDWFRTGFDLSAGLRYLLDSSRDHSLALIGSYQLREALGQSTGDARLLSLKLLFEPSDQYAFGVSFERGRNLDSLEFSKVWKATFGIRR